MEDGKFRFKLTEVTDDAEGEWEAEVEHEVPGKKEVRDRCRGNGTHVNPSIDGNGITGDEMHELGDEFCEDYMSGVYDVQCEECLGLRVVTVPDEENCTPAQKELLERYWKHVDDVSRWDREDATIRRMECGGYDY